MSKFDGDAKHSAYILRVKVFGNVVGVAMIAVGVYLRISNGPSVSPIPWIFGGVVLLLGSFMLPRGKRSGR